MLNLQPVFLWMLCVVCVSRVVTLPTDMPNLLLPPLLHTVTGKMQCKDTDVDCAIWPIQYIHIHTFTYTYILFTFNRKVGILNLNAHNLNACIKCNWMNQYFASKSHSRDATGASPTLASLQRYYIGLHRRLQLFKSL